MTWLHNGDATCDTCGRTYPGHEDKSMASQILRAAGWHHGSGQTIGGDIYEAILCPGCARDERRRSRMKTPISQEDLPLDWESYRRVEDGPGYQSR